MTDISLFTTDVIDGITKHRNAVNSFDERLYLWVKAVAAKLAKLVTEARITPEEVNEYSIVLIGVDPRLAIMLKATFDDAFITVDHEDGEVTVEHGHTADAYFPNDELLAPIEDVAKSYMLKLTEHINEQGW